VSYSLLILPRAAKELANLPAEQFNVAEAKIEALRENPRPANCKKLADRDAWRIRFGNYRVIYKIDDGNRTITVTNIGHRRGIYR
jgi:mRNA interferase RelE/StbE